VRGRGLFATAALVCLLSAEAPAWADAPPYATTDTDIADKLELKSFLGSEAKNHWSANTLGFDLAIPLAPRWEMTVVPRLTAVDGRRRSMVGFGDTEIAVKYLTMSESASWPAIAIEPNLTLPTGSRHMGDGSIALQLPVLISKGFGPWRLSGQFAFERDVMRARNDRAPLSLLLERTVTKNVTVGAEIAESLSMRRPNQGQLETNIGAGWAIRDGLRLEATIGRRLAGGGEPADVHSCLSLDIEL
jgi:hypothetical protein